MRNPIFILVLNFTVEIMKVRLFNCVINITSLFCCDILTANVAEFIRMIYTNSVRHCDMKKKN